MLKLTQHSNFPDRSAAVPNRGFLMMSNRLLSVAIITLALSTGSFAQKKSAKKKPKAKSTPVTQEQPAAPEPPLTPIQLTLAQKPAVAPKVQYQNGQLSIVAENSTLGDILRAVHQQTGAVVDLPPNATERVVANLGPGPSRDVLAKLLNGSSFNYVMLGSATDPNQVEHVIVSAKTGGDVGAMATNAPQPGFNGRTPFSPQAPQNQPMISGTPEGDAASEDTAEDPAGEAANDTANEEPAPAEEAPAAEGQPADQQGQPANGGIKTPEQLLQELQRQQQMQQQQMQQQGNPSAPQGFPTPPQPNQEPE
jgi:hypothetical protein